MALSGTLAWSDAQAMFKAEHMHIPVRLQHLVHAQVLWVNQRLIRQDPQYDGPDFSIYAYARHLLETCAFALPIYADLAGDASAIGVADRYGGTGLASNGGSGRSVFINGYYVKGVGPTPLVGQSTGDSHANGAACLEECIREAVMSELVAVEFPYGAVPVLAIIDTGRRHTWIDAEGEASDRSCLLVRPAFLRPAHFERAAGFLSGNPHEGAVDTARVASMFVIAQRRFGRAELAARFSRFWPRWAAQLAYGYVHRLPHCGNSTSNVTLDATLVDFGATAAMPNWARVSTVLGGIPVGLDVQFLRNALKSQVLGWARYLDAELGTPEALERAFAHMSRHYHLTIFTEILRILGLSRIEARLMLRIGPDPKQLARAAHRLLLHQAREQYAIFAGTPQPRIPWDIDQFWSKRPSAHLREMGTLLQVDAWGAVADQLSAPSTMPILAARCVLRAASRPQLFRETLRRNILNNFINTLDASTLTLERIARFIDEMVVGNRRDSRSEPDAAKPVGFGRTAEANYALFRCQRTGQMFAIREVDCDSDGLVTRRTNGDARLDVNCGPRGLIIADGAMPVCAFAPGEGIEELRRVNALG